MGKEGGNEGRYGRDSKFSLKRDEEKELK